MAEASTKNPSKKTIIDWRPDRFTQALITRIPRTEEQTTARAKKAAHEISNRPSIKN